ncbi:extensin [Iris pallida]|uniref:Extensin n=1 Tax=Iris pallida TaxID=29817 RepID=A0AAX6G847_IRIPA|nr:extensin [Iris pallida]
MRDATIVILVRRGKLPVTTGGRVVVQSGGVLLWWMVDAARDGYGGGSVGKELSSRRYRRCGGVRAVGGTG